MLKNLPANAGCGFDPWVGKIPWRRAWQPMPVFLPGEPMDRGTWRATVHRVANSRTWVKRVSTRIHITEPPAGDQQKAYLTSQHSTTAVPPPPPESLWTSNAIKYCSIRNYVCSWSLWSTWGPFAVGTSPFPFSVGNTPSIPLETKNAKDYFCRLL